MLAPAGDAADLDHVEDDDVARTSFARICAIVGASLVLIGCIGVMRWTAIGFGTLLLLLGVLAFLIGAEQRARADHDDPADFGEFDDRSDPAFEEAAPAALVPEPDADDRPVEAVEPTAVVGTEPLVVDAPPPADEAGALVLEPASDVPAPPDPAVADVPGADGPADTGDVVMVSFRLPATVHAEHANLVGEFNDWSPTSLPMLRRGGEFAIDVPLTVGRSYRYRYLLDHERWENSWSADGYLPNEFGTDDSVIDLSSRPLGAPDRRLMHGTIPQLAPTRSTPRFWRSRRVRRGLTMAWFGSLVAVLAVSQVRAAGSSDLDRDERPATVGVTEVSLDQRAVDIRLDEIVRRVQPVIADAAPRCLAAGAACAGDDLLALDTTRMRARSLGTGLTAATDRGTPAYLGRASDDTVDRATATGAAAVALADTLDRWLDGGCAAELEGVAVTGRPADCSAWAADAGAVLTTLEEHLAHWPE